MKHYDLIIIGTGSAMNILEPYLEDNPDAKVAVIEKDTPGGICLTRGCIPSKILLYPAELVTSIRKAGELGIEASIDTLHFNAVMARMRLLVAIDVQQIEQSLKASEYFDFYQATAEFVEPYVLNVDGETIKGDTILLCTGSKPLIPDIPGLEEHGYLTSDTFLDLQELPPSCVIIGGGYIAAEYGHFLSAMGSSVTIIGRNTRFLNEEEPEVSDLAQKDMAERMTILTGYEVVRIERDGEEKRVVARAIEGGTERAVTASEILVASGRAPNTDVLHPEKTGVETDPDGWIKTNPFFETTQKNIWAFGDATGNHLFKHVANYESELVYYNATRKQEPPMEPDYHAVPHAVFTQPEIASVGMKEAEAVKQHGEDNIAVGFSLYEQTAKGLAMDLQESGYFVKVLLHRKTGEILGAHIIGPEASVLIHEIIVAMNTENRRFPMSMMHIHPALNEVVEGAFGYLLTPPDYQHLLLHLSGEIEDDHHHHH
jgi:dihydrolipoamide dehydrogenase